MKLSLYQRLTMSLALVFVAVISMVVWWSSELQQKTQLESEQSLHLGLAEHLVTDNPLLAEGVYDYDALKGLFHTLMMLGPSFEFYYVDPQGKILTYSAEPGKVKRTHINVTPVKQIIEQNIPLPILGDDPRNINTSKIFSAAPVYKGEQLQGYLYMIIGGEIHDSVFASVSSNQTLRKASLVAAASIIFLLLVLLLLFKSFTRPITQLTNYFKQIDQTQFGTLNLDTQPWRDYSEDNEVQVLGSTFTKLVKQIQQQFQQLQNIDGHRRILLADLAHDLRTPLANLQGYLETLALKGGEVTPEERQRFTDIAMKNSRNLKRLIDQVFELAYLEGGQVTIHRENFPLGELLHDVVAKFDLKAKAKKLTLSIQPNQFEYQVFADIGKLERVLTNLLENAIRHTPENGAICLNVVAMPEEENRLRVEVADTGVGISQNEIAYIFDARYRATNTQEDKTPHAGLGLAISKKLMELLNSDLRVDSKMGKGTCFSFELSLASMT